MQDQQFQAQFSLLSYSLFQYISSLYIVIVRFQQAQEKQIGSHIILKATVILGSSLAFIIPLQLPLSVANALSQGGLNMDDCAITLTSIAIVYICFIAPFGIFYYQSDEDQPFLSRFLWSLLFAGISIFCSLAVLFITYSFLGTFSNGDRVSVSVYMISIYTTVGWIPFVFFTGFGLIFLPTDLILDFINRPIALRGEEAKSKKQCLLKLTEQMAQQAQALKQMQQCYQKQQGCWAKRKLKIKLDNKSKSFTQQSLLLIQQFQIFQKQLSIADTNIAVYWGYLVLGILSSIFSLLWFIQILIGSCIFQDGRPLYPFFGNMFVQIQAGGAGIVGAVIYFFFVIYLMAVYIKGTQKLGIKIPYILTMHPLRRNQTFINSLLFNIILIILGAGAITQLTTSTFSNFSQGSQLANIYNQMAQLKLYDFLYTKRVFPISLLVYMGISLIYFIIIMTCCKKKRLQLKTKKSYKRQKDTNLQMTDIQAKQKQ